MGRSRINIKALRSGMGLTTEEIAAKIGVTERTWSRWENGHYEPSPLAMVRLRELQTPDVPQRRPYDSQTATASAPTAAAMDGPPRGVVPSRRIS